MKTTGRWYVSSPNSGSAVLRRATCQEESSIELDELNCLSSSWYLIT